MGRTRSPTIQSINLSSSDRMHVLDAIMDALVELDALDEVSQRVIDKLLSARQILDEDISHS